MIDQYTYDKETPPQSLEELVDEGYLRDIPIDPINENRGIHGNLSRKQARQANRDYLT